MQNEFLDRAMKATTTDELMKLAEELGFSTIEENAQKMLDTLNNLREVMPPDKLRKSIAGMFHLDEKEFAELRDN